jgi:hypothetical protein
VDVPDQILVPMERIERAILMLRGHKVMLDADLAALYGVETKALVRAVKRNEDRFPHDFMFQLSREESDVQFRAVFEAIRQLMAPREPKRRRIGFGSEEQP